MSRKSNLRLRAAQRLVPVLDWLAKPSGYHVEWAKPVEWRDLLRVTDRGARAPQPKPKVKIREAGAYRIRAAESLSRPPTWKCLRCATSNPITHSACQKCGDVHP